MDLSSIEAQLRNNADTGWGGDVFVSQETARELIAIARAVHDWRAGRIDDDEMRDIADRLASEGR